MRSRRRNVTFPRHHLVNFHHRSTRPPKPIKSRNTNAMEDETLPLISHFLTEPPLLKDTLVTPSSTLQDTTLAECLPLLNGLSNPSLNPFEYDERGIKYLDRDPHIAFADDNLAPFPAPFVSIDASRPWMIYWALTALYFLGEDPTRYSQQVVKTFFPLQNASGGYGGGQGHYSHLAATYASVLSLALVGGTEAYELTNRQTMWSWLGRLKQADGGFQICEGGEEDTRAAYCALLVIALFNLPWELPPDAPSRRHGLNTFGDGLGEYISRCQTYEGGIASAPGTEAHGAYTFCGLAALCLLDAPHTTFREYLDFDAFLSWLSSRQYAPEGGFAGRTNKVVDGCYSHWLGDCFPLVQAALTGPISSENEESVGDLYNKEGLARYILNCCQNSDGGLRDKPSKRPDSYHTCYTLAGLSTGEHFHYYTDQNKQPQLGWAFAWHAVQHEQMRRERVRSLVEEPSSGLRGGMRTDMHAEEEANEEHPVLEDSDFDSDCKLRAVHPVFVIPHYAVSKMREWAVTKQDLTRIRV